MLFIKKSIIPVLMGTTLLLGSMFSERASASFMSCTGGSGAGAYDISGNVDPNDGCTILQPIGDNANDKVSGNLTVNTESFFTYSNWFFDGKWDSDPDENNWTDTSALFNFTGGADAGTFELVGNINSFDDVMFVFKDGSNTNLVGYLFSDDDPGTYTSPFEDPPFDIAPASSPKDISHISVYYRTTGIIPPQELPEPGMLVLLGAGLVGFGLSRRRRV